MARGYRAHSRQKINSWPVWLAFCVVFHSAHRLPQAACACISTCWRCSVLDLALVLQRQNILTSVLAYPPLVTCSHAASGSARARDRCAPSAAVEACGAARCGRFPHGFRVGLNLEDST
jgi:hypothetical protein